MSKIDCRRQFAGSGMMGTPEYLEELQERRDLHERITRGKPARPFSAVLFEKMHGKPEKEAPAETVEKGAREPHMGLSPGQSPDLAQGGKGRRSVKVIVKG